MLEVIEPSSCRVLEDQLTIPRCAPEQLFLVSLDDAGKLDVRPPLVQVAVLDPTRFLDPSPQRVLLKPGAAQPLLALGTLRAAPLALEVDSAAMFSDDQEPRRRAWRHRKNLATAEAWVPEWVPTKTSHA